MTRAGTLPALAARSAADRYAIPGRLVAPRRALRPLEAISDATSFGALSTGLAFPETPPSRSREKQGEGAATFPFSPADTPSPRAQSPDAPFPDAQSLKLRQSLSRIDKCVAVTTD